MRKLEASLQSLRGAAREYAAALGHGSGPRGVAWAPPRDGRAALIEPSEASPAAPKATRAGLVARVVMQLRAIGRKLARLR